MSRAVDQASTGTNMAAPLSLRVPGTFGESTGLFSHSGQMELKKGWASNGVWGIWLANSPLELYHIHRHSGPEASKGAAANCISPPLRIHRAFSFSGRIGN